MAFSFQCILPITGKAPSGSRHPGGLGGSRSLGLDPPKDITMRWPNHRSMMPSTIWT